MEKNVIEVILQPEVKKEKESILILLFRKKRFILFITFIGLIIGLIVSPMYYLREHKRADAASAVQQQPTIISENVFNRQFLSQATREREPGNLHIAEQLRYDVFLTHKTINDVIIHLFKGNYATEKKSFEDFQILVFRKLAIDSYSQFHEVNLGPFTAKIDDYVTRYPYLLANDDKNVLKARIQANQSIIDAYNLAIINNTNNIASAQVLVDIEALNKENKILEELIQGSTANDPDPRGTQIAAAQINALCKTLDEVKLELLTMIDNYTSTTIISPAPSLAPSLLNVVAIGLIFPCMAFIAAILLVLLSDWWHKFLEEQRNPKTSDD